MLQNTKELYRDKLSAIDGDIGQVKDFYFDDKTWMVRYLVVDTGNWLTGRLVLLSPHALGKLDQFEKTLHVKLDKKQIENGPAIESHLPVSRQYEAEYYRYYGWPVYWDTEAAWVAFPWSCQCQTSSRATGKTSTCKAPNQSTATGFKQRTGRSAP